MNKKRKILTVVALAVFGAIIFFHYGSIDYKSAYEKVEYFRDKTVKPASWEDFKPATPKPFDFVPDKPPKKGTSDIFDDLPDQPPKKRITADEFRKKNLFAASKGEFVIVEYPATGLYLSSYLGIKDVRMPLLVLAVFYAGLFCILGNKKNESHEHAGNFKEP